MKDLIIVGASGFGRELLQWIMDINKEKPTWNVLGFIDDNLSALDGKKCSFSVLSTISDFKFQKSIFFALAIARPKTKEAIVNKLKLRGAEFVNIIHPRAKISDSAIYGDGFVMYPDAKLGPDTKVGNYVTLLSSGIGHDAIVEDYTTISSFCDITGGVKLGKCVFLASHSTIIPNIVIGDNSYIGAGSVVIRNVKSCTKVFGNPAREIDV